VLGFVSGGFWIFIISREVISVLETVGIVLGISDSIMGLTFLAIGNSIGDLVTNIMVARLGFYSMAIAACFGAPLLNSLFTIGISGLAFENLKSSNGDSVLGIPFNVITLISCIALICATLSNLLILGLRNNFELRLSYSICLVICVCLIIGVNITIEVAKQL
jgi:sodium/potassium/calcium exchanger 6